MITLQIEKRGDRHVLVERDYPAQGISPFYTVVCELEAEEARALHATKLIRFKSGDPSPGPASDPAGLVFLREPFPGRLELRLRLPASGSRRKAVDIACPGYDGILKIAASDPAKRANLLRNTGISSLGHDGGSAVLS